MTEQIVPGDRRLQSKYATLNGRRYHYVEGTPKDTTPTATIFLIHGWPDCHFGFRYQIPLLLSLNLRVIVPDMMGYGRSSAPEALSNYTMKTACDDLAALAKQLSVPQIFILGHDWGGYIVWRFALYYPELVRGVVSVCTPYGAPSKAFYPLEQMVESNLPNFRYQLQLAGPDVQANIVGKDRIRQFLNAIYGGRSKDGKVGFNTQQGVIFDNLASLQKTKLLSDEELDHYTELYAINGIRGPLNWYRTRKLNFEDERSLAAIKDLKVTQPCLFVATTRDEALPLRMSQGMGKYCTDLTRVEVEAGHWVLWQKPQEVNEHISKWLKGQLGKTSGRQSRL